MAAGPFLLQGPRTARAAPGIGRCNHGVCAGLRRRRPFRKTFAMFEPGLIQGLRRAVQLRADHIAVVDGTARFTWAGVADRVARLSAAFRALGLQAGDRVALLALNSHRSLETFLATLHAGGAVVPLNHRLSDSELAAQIADCSPRILLLGEDFVQLAAGLASAAPGMAALIEASGRAAPAPGLQPYEQLVAAHAPGPDSGRCGRDLACIFYTSGTTSAAKGVMLCHANIMANTANVLASIPMDTDSVHLHHGPLFHVAAGVRLFSVTHAAGKHVFLPRFVASEVLETIAREGVTIATFVPTMLRAMLDDPLIRTADLSCLKLISYGSAPMPEPLLREVMEALPHVRFVQSYGMTELSPVATMLGWREHLPDMAARGLLRSAGRAVTTAEVAIMGPDGAILPTGATGEVVVRGPMVMLGYWNRPDLTAEALRGGYMHTGDVGYLDADGYLFIVDRLKDMIITGGENVYSQEVENCLAAHPAVSQCAVFGRPHPHWGEAVHATVTLKAGETATPEALIAHCRAHIAHYKCPRTLEIRTAPMPLSGANKILKSVLRDELLAREETPAT